MKEEHKLTALEIAEQEEYEKRKDDVPEALAGVSYGDNKLDYEAFYASDGTVIIDGERGDEPSKEVMGEDDVEKVKEEKSKEDKFNDFEL